MKRFTSKALTVMLFSTSLIGCAQNNETGTAPEPKISTEPKTITLYRYGVNLTDEEFQNFFVEPVKKKYPHITLQMVVQGKGMNPEDLLAAGTFPDIIFTSNNMFQAFKDLKVVQNLDEMIKKDSTELKKVQPVIMDSFREYGDRGELVALPFSINVAALLYNKDLFDKFGVEYPKDLMTWDETIALARKLMRNEGGVQYAGFDSTGASLIATQLSLPFVDPKTNKSLIDSPEWIKVYKLINEFYRMEGFNNLKQIGREAFITDQTIAMLPLWADNFTGRFETEYKKGTLTLNWDMVALPNFPEALGTGREANVHAMMLSGLSNNKDDALSVMMYMLSDEVQTAIAKSGRFSTLEGDEFEKVFGAELESLKGKHIEAFFKAKPRKIHTPTKYDQTIVRGLTDAAAEELRITNKDINTLVREYKEKADKAIAEAIEKSK